MKKILSLLSATCFAFLAAGQTDPLKIQTVFFGLDNALPFTANVFCRGAAGQDGLILTLSHQVDAGTLQASDIRVYKANGDSATPQCATLAPAAEGNELRTILLIGELGNNPANPPVAVRIVGDLFSLASLPTDPATCSPARNMRGLFSSSVIPLPAGPVIAYAQKLDSTRWQLGLPQSPGVGAGCPTGTQMVVQVAWSGGVVSNVAGENDSRLYRYYTVWVDSAGVAVPRTPYQIADLNDNDNYHDLCMNTRLKPLRVSFAAGRVRDPNGDPNPATQLDLKYCLSPGAAGLWEAVAGEAGPPYTFNKRRQFVLQLTRQRVRH